jgi:hypothetical protein
MKPSDFNFWSRSPEDASRMFFVLGAILLGFLVVFGLMQLPTQARRAVTWVVTFLSGGFIVMYAYWPKPVNFKSAEQKPSTPVENVGAWLGDSFGVMSSFAQILAALMLGLGIYSLLRIHIVNIAKKKKDWSFSVVLLFSMISMITFGYWDYSVRQASKTTDYDIFKNWQPANMGRDFLFEGLLQQMDAAMFSIIAFFILSAAYRAFRARSVEATILLGTALLVIFSLMGAVSFAWDGAVDNLAAGKDSKDFIQNFRISDIAAWIRGTFQTPSITGIKFGIGLGTLSMALRIWLGLERGSK